MSTNKQILLEEIRDLVVYMELDPNDYCLSHFIDNFNISSSDQELLSKATKKSEK